MCKCVLQAVDNDFTANFIWKMSPKGRKSLSCSWYTCEGCGAIMTQKDMQLHKDQMCPPDCTVWEHGFIKDQMLYSFIEDVDISDVPDMGRQEKHFFVFMSQSAMQLCRFEIGEDILVVMDKNESFVRKVWPTSEKSLVSVIFPKEVRLGNKNSSVPENTRVKVQKLPRKPFPASHIHLTSKEDICSSSIEQLLIMCRQKYAGKLLQPSTSIAVWFYGKDMVFTVKNILSSCKVEDILTDQLEDLSVDGNNHRQSYFLVVESTNWEILINTNKAFPQTTSKLITFKTIGGYDKIKQELFRAVYNGLENNKSQSQCPSSMGILLHGPNGVGKTFLVQALCNELNCHVVKLISGELFSKFYGETENRLRNLFTEAKQKAPSVIVIDNVDTLCPRRGGTEQERRVIAYLLTLLDSLTLEPCRTVVVATTSQLSLVDSSLRRPGRLDWELELHIPTISDRYEILKVLLSNWTIAESEMMQVAAASHGYVAADLVCLVAKAAMHRTNNLVWALSQVKPSAMREVLIQVPNVKWSDIGGMDDLKLKLKQAIEWPLSHPEAFSRLGINPPRGVLMYGPPGCSKTMIAKALATESKLNFLSIKGSELFSKWVGESEKAVESLFRKARAVAPSIVFLDELDALGGERGGNVSEGSNVQERVLAQLLTEMDGVEPLGDVNIVAATNRPDRVDKALLRPGRLDRLVYVPLPDLSTRACILKLQLAKMPVAGDVLADNLALKTEGYSGAEIVAVCHEAAMSALQEDLNTVEVCRSHFESALATVKPRTPLSLLHLYDTYSNSAKK